jgi:hypothetical protein
MSVADAVRVQHAGQFRDRLIGAGERPAADEQRVGHHGDEERAVDDGAAAGGGDAGKRVPDGRVGGGVHRHHPGRGLTGAGQIQQFAARVGRQRLGLV